MTEIISKYRILLRYLKSLPSPSNEIKFKNLINKVRNSNDIQRNKRLLNSYVNQVTAIKQLNYLRSLDSGEKLSQRDKIRASARRVGLATPGFFGDEATK